MNEILETIETFMNYYRLSFSRESSELFSSSYILCKPESTTALCTVRDYTARDYTDFLDYNHSYPWKHND